MRADRNGSSATYHRMVDDFERRYYEHPGERMATTTPTLETADVRWDLSIFYSHLDDPGLASDVIDLEAMAKRFSAAYKGKLAELLGPAIKDYSEIEMLSSKIGSYLSLLESTDLANAAIKA